MVKKNDLKREAAEAVRTAATARLAVLCQGIGKGLCCYDSRWDNERVRELVNLTVTELEPALRAAEKADKDYQPFLNGRLVRRRKRFVKRAKAAK